MSDIVRPIQVEARWLEGVAAAVIRFRSAEGLGEWVRPANTGFGFSYALPVIVAGLATPVGGTLLIENPEAHLHPAGQSAMGRFLARVAAAGTQVIVETHSDHVVNGIRVAAVSDADRVGPETLIYYFEPEGEPHVMTLSESGAVSSWPEGFFDQIQVDLAALARARRERRGK
jgi:predicted ATPase